MNAKAKPAGKPNTTGQDTKFYSPTGEDIRVPLPDGRVAIVNEARTLPPAFHRAALRNGCFPEGTAQIVADVKPKDDPLQRRELIKDKIFEILAALPADHAPEAEHQAFAANYQGALNNDGSPNVRFIEESLGFNIDASERDAAFAEVQQELLRGDNGDEDENDGSEIGNID